MKREKFSIDRSILINRIIPFDENDIWLIGSGVNCKFCHKNINVISNNWFDITKIKKHINKKINYENEMKMKKPTKFRIFC